MAIGGGVGKSAPKWFGYKKGQIQKELDERMRTHKKEKKTHK